MIKLTCPSCNGSLELPDNLGIAHCMYCGTKILLQQPDTAKEKEAIQRYKELCKTALESKNYDEVIKFCNNILEIDTKDVDAWIYKAEATWWFTTETNNHYNEATEYLKKAEEISPVDPRVQVALDELKHRQSNWFIYLGKEKIKCGDEIMDNYNRSIYYDMADKLEALANARGRCTKYYTNAMIDFFSAANIFPHDSTPLKNIEDLTMKVKWIDWQNINIVKKAIHNLRVLRDKPIAQENLPEFRKMLQTAQSELALLKKKNYIFNKSKIDEAERWVSELKVKVSKCEETISMELLF